MSTVPYNRVVNVTVDINDRFPTVANFAIPLILVSDAASLTNISTDIVKAFSSLAEVEAYGFTPESPAYKTVQAMLATNNNPRTFKIGFRGDDVLSGLQDVFAEDSLFYNIVMADPVLPGEVQQLIEANDFLITERKILLFDTFDLLSRDDPQDEAGVGAQLRALQPSRLIGNWLEQVDAGVDRQQYAAKVAAFLSSVNYNSPDSHFTAKFIQLDGALPTKVNGIEAQNITGFLPGTGQNADAGGFLNTYVCTAGINYYIEGTMTDGSFIDLMTFSDWLVADLQRNVLALYTNNRVVPYDNVGQAMIYGAISQTMQTAVQSGALTQNRQDESGDFLPAFTIDLQNIADVPDALVADRIAPLSQYCARYAGAMHYSDVTGVIKLAQ